MSMRNNDKITSEKLSGIISKCDPELISKSFNSGGKCGNEGLFKFCMYLKELFHLHEAMPYIKQWHEKWRDKLIDKTGYQLSLEDIEVMAEMLWDKIDHSPGGQLAAAIANAKKRYTETIPELGDYGGKPAKLLALVCFELQEAAKDNEPFFISSYDAAEIMGLDRKEGQRRAARTLKVFARKGIIIVHKIGHLGRSTRYYYTGSPPREAY